MIQWTPYVFVRLTFYLVAGILTAVHFPSRMPPLIGFSFTVGLMGVFVVLARLRYRHLRLNTGWPGLLAVYLIGYLSVPLRSEARYPDHLVHCDGEIQSYTAVVTSYPGQGASTWKQLVRVRSVLTREGWGKASGKVLLYVDFDGYEKPFAYGDILLIKGTPTPVPGPLNPGEFDYRRFLALRQIHRQQYIGNGQALRIGNDPPSHLMKFSITARTWAVQQYRRFVPGRQEQVVTSALVLGDKDGLDDDLYDAFSSSGTMHVLAVSGLHVGIIYSIIIFVLRPLKKVRGGKLCVALVSIIMLWGYALVTGLSPSVLRATVMFMFVTLAEPWGRRSSIYNTFALSGFVLLLLDPNLIFSVGFQLSYAAVFGIVYFYPRLVALWEPSSWLARKVWEMSSVSLAAQIATFPIALYYFHQFPVYFLLANLAAIPLSFAILVAGIFLLMVSVWTPVAGTVGSLVHYLVFALNQSVAVAASLPFGVVKDIYISSLQCWMLIGLVIACILLVELRRMTVVYAGVALALIFSADAWIRAIKCAETARLVVYQIRGHYGFGLVEDSRSYFFADSSLQAQPARLAYHIGGYRLATGIRTVLSGDGKPFVSELQGGRLICWREYTIIHIFGRQFEWPQNVTVDYAIVSHNAVRGLDGFRAQQLIVDGSNSNYVVGTLEKDASQRAVTFYATERSGAFIKEI